MPHVPPSATTAETIDAQLEAEGVPALLSLRDAAAIAHKSTSALARLARAGVVRAMRPRSVVGRGPWLITRAALASYLAGEER